MLTRRLLVCWMFSSLHNVQSEATHDGGRVNAERDGTLIYAHTSPFLGIM